MAVLFWCCLGALFWAYAGYPAALLTRAALRRLRPARAPRSFSLPAVSVIVAVRNAADDLAERVTNLLAQDYPPDRLEVIVVSNGSTDDTDRIGARLAAEDRRVRALRSPAEAAKAGALDTGAAAARGDVLVFADARQRFERRALRHLVRSLRDPTVGGVSGRLVIARSDAAVVEGVSRYWQLETRLRLAESRTGSVVGATGAIYALRRSLFQPIPPGLILDDVYLPLTVVRRGFRMTLNPRALAFDRPSGGYRAEYARRVRTLVGNYELLRALPWLLSPTRNPVFLRYVSHKLLRLLTPALAVGLLVSGLLLPGLFYRVVAASLIAVYALGLIGLVARARVFALPAAFVLLHTAGIAALIRPTRRAAQVWTAR